MGQGAWLGLRRVTTPRPDGPPLMARHGIGNPPRRAAEPCPVCPACPICFTWVRLSLSHVSRPQGRWDEWAKVVSSASVSWHGPPLRRGTPFCRKNHQTERNGLGRQRGSASRLVRDRNANWFGSAIPLSEGSYRGGTPIWPLERTSFDQSYYRWSHCLTKAGTLVDSPDCVTRGMSSSLRTITSSMRTSPISSQSGPID
jgi:hypothetical protein